jgi:diguanylate cyclase (GGDEF)-like protein
VALPAFLNLRRLEGRIVGLFLALLLVVQLASFAVIRSSIARNADTSIAAELKTGERVFRRLLVQEAEKRSDAAALLAQDYGFKQAIGLPLAQADTVETIQSALANQGERIGASVVAYFDTELKLVAATRDDAARFQDLLKQKAAQDGRPGAGDDVQLALLDGRAYQVVAVPVRTPAPAGWILMGFVLDGGALQDLRSLSELQGIVVVRNDGQRWMPLVSSLDSDDAALLSEQIPADKGLLFPADVAGEQWRGRLAPLERRDPYRLGVVLLRSFDAAVAPYRSLQLILLALTVAGVGVFACFSVLLARRISGPIKALGESAGRLGRGDYDTPVVRISHDEVGDLAAAFELMRQGIRMQTAKAERLAYWDELTGLPNRARFRNKLEDAVQAERPFAVLMLNLDRFKHVNDVLGHDFGDLLLIGVGSRLQQLCRDQALLARVGGDAFALLLPGADQSAALAMAAAILQDFFKPLRIGSHTVDLSAGIGAALYPRDGADVMQLLSRAELAMYAAKQRQCGSLVYDAQLDAGSPESLSLLSELRQAIDGQELRLYLQPKVDLKTGHVTGAEALLRWQHPTRGLVPPGQFIPFAEQTGFIRELTQWVIAEAARSWRAAADAGIRLPLSVNLSTRDLLDQDLPGKIAALIAGVGVEPRALCLEITETAIMLDPQRARSTLEQLSAMGFKLSIDDFGTGHSSLAYLKDLPVDELKIDMSFVKAMATSRADRRIVRSTIELAHNLDLSVVAEGIETAAAWQLLASYGCDDGQGFFVGRPMPQRQFVEWLADWQAPELGEEAPDTVFEPG